MQSSWATFVRKFVANKVHNLPNLVALSDPIPGEEKSKTK